MDSKDNDKLILKQKLKSAAKEIGWLNVLAPERGKANKLPVHGSNVYVTFRHEQLGSDQGEFLITLVEDGGKQTRLADEKYHGAINSNAAWVKACLKASNTLKDKAK